MNEMAHAGAATSFERVFATPTDGHYFFGYYDKSPLDAASRRLLAHRTPFIKRMPEAGEAAEIGYFDIAGDGAYVPLARTTAWNWQQGAMLQWLGPDFKRRILFNDIRDAQYRAVILDLETGSETVLPMPVYAATPDGAVGLCVDYDRLYWHRPGYNYQGAPRPEKKAPYDPADGIWRMSFETGALEKIVAIDDVIALGRQSSMEGAAHYLEHLMINPSGDRFVFLHRWLNVDGGIVAHMVTADLDGGGLFLLNDSGRMSHFCWRGDDTVFGYGGAATALNKLRSRKAIAKNVIKPLLPLYHRLFPPGGAVSRRVTGDCFQLFKDQTSERTRIDRSILPEDGHPSFRPGDRAVIINDTYADEAGDCRLYLFDVEERRILGEIAIPSDPSARATGYRCDLHPKWSVDGRFVAIDTMTTAGRGISLFAVDLAAAGEKGVAP